MTIYADVEGYCHQWIGDKIAWQVFPPAQDAQTKDYDFCMLLLGEKPNQMLNMIRSDWGHPQTQMMSAVAHWYLSFCKTLNDGSCQQTSS